MKWMAAALLLGFGVGQISRDNWRAISQGWFPWHKQHEWVAVSPGSVGQVMIEKDGQYMWVDPSEANQKEKAK